MNYLDLDAVANEAAFTIKLNGVQHTLKPATVETFLTNMKELEKLAMNATAATEIEVAIGIVERGFPTVPKEQLRELTLIQLKTISEFAQGMNGEKVEKPVEDASGNASAANG